MNNNINTHQSIQPVWQDLLDASQAGIFLLDLQYTVIWINNYAANLPMGKWKDRRIAIGDNFVDFAPSENQEELKTALSRVKEGESFIREMGYVSTSGKTFLKAAYSPIRGESNGITNICVTLSNVTDLVVKENELRTIEQRWKYALEGTGNGVWEYNFQTGKAYYSTYYKRMRGIEDADFEGSINSWRESIHPDDKHLADEIHEAYKSNQISQHQIEYRFQTKSGEYIWILDIGSVLERDENGNVIKIIGTNKDISLWKEASEKLRLSEQRFISFMDNSPTMSWIMDENCIYHYMNEEYRRVFNLEHSAVGKSMYEIFPKAVCDQYFKNNLFVWEQNTAIEIVEDALLHDGRKVKLQIFKFPLPKEKGIRLLGGVALDITEKIETSRALEAEREENKRALIHGIIDAQEKERDELAYQLHENVNQVLTSAKLMLEVAAENPALSGEFVKKTIPYIGEAITELRNLSHGLRPATLTDISLEAAVAEAVQKTNNSGKLKVHYSYGTDGSGKQISSEIQLVVLRAVQEQLTNIVKHAGATTAEVRLEISAHNLELEIVDNGKGFDKVRIIKAVGLNNIINRIEYHNGSWAIESEPGKGCTFKIEIPLANP